MAKGNEFFSDGEDMGLLDPRSYDLGLFFSSLARGEITEQEIEDRGFGYASPQMDF